MLLAALTLLPKQARGEVQPARVVKANEMNAECEGK